MSISSPRRWLQPEGFPAVPSEGVVHLWRRSVARRPAAARRLWPLLSASEKQRAERYRFAEDRRAFVLRRGTLRLLLGRYLHVPPECIRFAYNDHGKPSVHATHASSLCFNLSSTDDLVLYAFASTGPLGVDVERKRPIEDLDGMVEHVFSPLEREAFLRLSSAERLRGFLNGWTRKEAFVKAVGAGLSLPLDTFDVTLAPGRPAALLTVRAAACDTAWSLHALRPTPHHIASLAVRGPQKHLHCFIWPASEEK